MGNILQCDWEATSIMSCLSYHCQLPNILLTVIMWFLLMEIKMNRRVRIGCFS